MSRHVPTTIAWWLFRAPYRARNALLRSLDVGAPLVPEPAAVLLAAGGVAVAAEGAWMLLAGYVTACAAAVAFAWHTARARRL